MVRQTPLFEDVFPSSALVVDRENRIIRNVKLLGFESKNPARLIGGLTQEQRIKWREYLNKPYGYDAASALTVAERYNGIQVFEDHPSLEDRKAGRVERSSRELVGCVQNAVARADGIYGDIHYLTEFEAGRRAAEVAERMPTMLGCSHAATMITYDLRQNRVTAIDWTPRTVDIVTEPATTSGMHESYTEPKPMKLSEFLAMESVARLKDTNKLAAALFEMSDGSMGNDVQTMEMDEPAEVSPEDQIKSAIVAAISAKMESASEDELLAVMECLGMSPPLTGGDTSGEATEADMTDDKSEDDKKTVEESLKTERQINAKLLATNLLLEANRKVTDVRVEAVMASSNPKLLIESWTQDRYQAGTPGTRPAKSPPVQGGRGSFETMEQAAAKYSRN